MVKHYNSLLTCLLLGFVSSCSLPPTQLEPSPQPSVSVTPQPEHTGWVQTVLPASPNQQINKGQQSVLLNHDSQGFALHLTHQGHGLLMAKSSDGSLPTLIPLTNFVLQEPFSLESVFPDPHLTYQEALNLNQEGSGHLLRLNTEKGQVQSPFGPPISQISTLNFDILSIQNFKPSDRVTQLQLGIPYTEVRMRAGLLDTHGNGYISFTGRQIPSEDTYPDPYTEPINLPAPSLEIRSASTLQRHAFFLPIHNYQIQSERHHIHALDALEHLIQPSTQVWLNAAQDGLCIYQTGQTHWFAQVIQAGQFNQEPIQLGLSQSPQPQIHIDTHGQGHLLFHQQLDTDQSEWLLFPINNFLIQAPQKLPLTHLGINSQVTAQFQESQGLAIVSTPPNNMFLTTWELQAHTLSQEQPLQQQTLQHPLGNGWHPSQNTVLKLSPEGKGLLAWQLFRPDRLGSMIRLQAIEHYQLQQPLNWDVPPSLNASLQPDLQPVVSASPATPHHSPAPTPTPWRLE